MWISARSFLPFPLVVDEPGWAVRLETAAHFFGRSCRICPIWWGNHDEADFVSDQRERCHRMRSLCLRCTGAMVCHAERTRSLVLWPRGRLDGPAGHQN